MKMSVRANFYQNGFWFGFPNIGSAVLLEGGFNLLLKRGDEGPMEVTKRERRGDDA
jgi:hypothetical protein